MCDQKGYQGWTYIVGDAYHDRWVMISPDGRTFLIGEWESTGHGVKKTVRVENNTPRKVK